MTTERTAEAPAPAACLVCGAQVAGGRCDTCGAAVGPGGMVAERLLAQTESGRVYRSRSDHAGPVAVKELVFTLAPTVKQVDDFEREARLLAQLDHPGIPKFLGHFREGSGVHLRLYNVQQYVEGTSLEVMIRQGPLSGVQAREIGRQLLEIVSYLHRREPPVVHRDIKPANVLLRDDGRLALVDFGIAREVRAGGTHGATLAGTFGYMSPEQMGGSATPASDLYGVGATLLHLVSGRHPQHLLTAELGLDLGTLGLDDRWRTFLARLLARDPRERFRSAEEALRQVAMWQAPRRSLLRRRLIGVGAAVLAAGLGLTLVRYRIEPRAALVAVDPSLQLEAFVRSHPAPASLPADLEPVVASLIRTGAPRSRREALGVAGEARAEGLEVLDASLEALDRAATADDLTLAQKAVAAQLQGRARSAITPERMRPLESLLFWDKTSAISAEDALESRLLTSGIILQIFPLPPSLLNRLRVEMRAPGTMSNQYYGILFNHLLDQPYSEEEALAMLESKSANERQLGVGLLGKRFPSSRAGARRVRELATRDPDASVRSDAELLAREMVRDDDQPAPGRPPEKKSEKPPRQ